MKPIAIFYHTCLNLHPDKSHALELLAEQARALYDSGLLGAANQIIIGVNGPEEDGDLVRELTGAESAGSDIICHEPDQWGGAEVPTLQYLHDWLPGFPDYHVLYLHMKGLSHVPGSYGYSQNADWRRSMQGTVIGRWRECVKMLEQGYDSVGQWWHVAPNGAYWAGNFWWATAKFLSTLPPIDPTGQIQGGRYEAEVWIGRGPRYPKVKTL